MTIGLTNSYTTVVVIPEFAVSGRVTNANTGVYTCPAGRKALVKKASAVIDALGVDSTYAVAVKRGVTFFPIGEFVGLHKESSGSALLNAGDILTNFGDAGSTNGTVDMDAIIQETTV